MARDKFPGSPASLDALCRRFSITDVNRQLHGALLDSYILARVYLELIGGDQPKFLLNEDNPKKMLNTQSSIKEFNSFSRSSSLPSRLNDDERREHKNFIAKINGLKFWSIYN